MAAHDPVRDSVAGDRQRGLLPQHAAQARPRRRPRRLRDKIAAAARATPEYADCKIADYGTRRRFSRRMARGGGAPRWRDELGPQFAGTSNVLLRDEARPGAARHDGARIPAGVPGAWTAAARFADVRAAKSGRRNTAATSASRCPTCTAWTPSCATSTCTSASCSTALRHDSGDPFEWGEKAARALRRQPRSTRAPSAWCSRDGLDMPKVLQLYAHFPDRSQLAFGIGTNLTNDVGSMPLQHRDEDDPLQRPAGGQAVATRRARRCATTRPSSPTCARCSRSRRSRAERRAMA